MKPNTLARIWREVKEVNADFFNLRTVVTPDEDSGGELRFWFVMLPNDGAMAHLSLVGSLAVGEVSKEPRCLVGYKSSTDVTRCIGIP